MQDIDILDGYTDYLENKEAKRQALLAKLKPRFVVYQRVLGARYRVYDTIDNVYLAPPVSGYSVVLDAKRHADIMNHQTGHYYAYKGTRYKFVLHPVGYGSIQDIVTKLYLGVDDVWVVDIDKSIIVSQRNAEIKCNALQDEVLKQFVKTIQSMIDSL